MPYPQRLRVTGERVYVPSVGWARIRQSQAIEFTTKSATFKGSAAGHWFVMLVVEFEVPTTKAPVREEEAAGFDMVLQPPNFLMDSEGGEIAAPRFDRARERKLRPAQKHLSRARRDSRNRGKARRRVAKIQERTAHLRQQFLHKLSHWIVATWSVICFENVSLKSLPKTKHAKSWLDGAFGELLRQPPVFRRGVSTWIHQRIKQHLERQITLRPILRPHPEHHYMS